MAPAIVAGDVLVVDPGPLDLRVGDVAVFRVGSGRVVHRVIATSPGRQMGDNTWRHDRFAPDDVIGRVVEIQRGSEVRSLVDRPARIRGRVLVARGICRLAWSKAVGPTMRHRGTGNRLSEV